MWRAVEEDVREGRETEEDTFSFSQDAHHARGVDAMHGRLAVVAVATRIIAQSHPEHARAALARIGQLSSLRVIATRTLEVHVRDWSAAGDRFAERRELGDAQCNLVTVEHGRQVLCCSAHIARTQCQ